MPIQIQCPKCNLKANVPDSAAGKSARCKCGATIQIPASEVYDGMTVLSSSEPAPNTADQITLQPGHAPITPWTPYTHLHCLATGEALSFAMDDEQRSDVVAAEKHQLSRAVD